jgi:Fur family peroxide stress response transcriptional regulator
MIMPKNKGEAEKVLREQGARVTPQRVAIFKAVESSGSHPDADAVYKRVSREYPHISRDTVYRTLSMMEEKKIIGSVLSFGNAKRYDPNTNKHHHLICIRCRNIFDFDAEVFDRLEPPASRIASFQVFRITVHVEGICDKCQGRKKA